MGKDVDEFLYQELGPGALDPPQGTAWVWSLFLTLHSQRQHSGSGFQAISYTEILSWTRLTQIPLQVWEITALRNLDNTWLTWHNKKDKPDGGVSRTRDTSKH